MKSLTQAEIVKLLKASSDNVRDHAALLLTFRHGMRASETCNLELKDVDMKAGEIVIRRLKGSLKTTQPLADLQGQPLLSEKRVLRAWLAERGNHPSKYVFVSQKSGRMNRSTFYRMFQKYAEMAGLPADKQHPHTLKHSLAVLLVEANTNLATVRVALGHKSIQSTVVYAQPSDESAGRAVLAALASL